MFNSNASRYTERRNHRRQLERARAKTLDALQLGDEKKLLVSAQELQSAYGALVRDMLKLIAWKNEAQLQEAIAHMINGYQLILSLGEDGSLPSDLRVFFARPNALGEAISAAIEEKKNNKKGKE